MAQKKNSIRMRARSEGGATKIEMLIDYKIATGLVRDKKTKKLEVKKPQKFVKTVTVWLAGKQVFTGNLSIGSSDDPFLAIKVKGGKAGDPVKIRWDDNLGNWDEASHPVS